MGDGRRKSLSDILKGRTGIWYDPQDLTTLFQNAAGTLPVYRPGTGLVDPPVGLLLDNGQGLELGPELILNLTNWYSIGDWSVDDNKLTRSVTGTVTQCYKFLYQDGRVVRYKRLSVVLDVTVASGTFLLLPGGYQVAASITTSGVHSFDVFMEHASGNGHIYLRADAAFAGTVNSLSIREIKGYHAYQSTTTARPTLSGRYNLLTATETLATQSVTTAATDYTLSFSGTGTLTLSGTATGTYSAGTHTITCTAGTLTCTVAGAVTRADLRIKRDGSSLPAYQSVTNANTYDTAGFPLFLKRDKVDDVLTCVAPAITGSQGMGSTGGAVLGPVIIPAGTYTPLSESATTGIPEITRYVAIDGALTASERAVVERYLSAPSSGVFADEPVFSFGLTSVASFSFILRTKADTAPVLIDWGDGTQSTHAGTTDQTASHTYAVSGTYAVKVYGADESVLTRFSTSADGISGALVIPSGMTYFVCTGSNTLTGTLSLPSGMTAFVCYGSNTLTGTLSMPSGMTYFLCHGSNTLSGYTPSAKASNQQRFNLIGLNTLSAADVDNILIDYAAAGGTWSGSKEITIQGNAANRTSASDAAYASLATKLTTLNVD